MALLVHLQLHEAVGQAEELVRALQAAAPGHRAVPHDRFGALEGRAELPLDLRQDQMLPLHPQREPRWLERREAAPAEAGAVLGPVVAGRRLAEVDVGAAAARAAAVLQAARAGVLRQQPAARLGAEPPAAVRLAAVEAGLRGAAAAGVGAAHAAAVADAPAPRGLRLLGAGRAVLAHEGAAGRLRAAAVGAAEAAALLRAHAEAARAAAEAALAAARQQVLAARAAAVPRAAPGQGVHAALGPGAAGQALWRDVAAGGRHGFRFFEPKKEPKVAGHGFESQKSKVKRPHRAESIEAWVDSQWMCLPQPCKSSKFTFWANLH